MDLFACIVEFRLVNRSKRFSAQVREIGQSAVETCKHKHVSRSDAYECAEKLLSMLNR